MANPTLLAFDLHNQLLRCLSLHTHFNGLQMAGRHHLRAGAITKTFYKRLCNLDITFNVLRHLTQAFAYKMISEAEAFMSSGYTQTLGAEPGQRKADIYVPIGEQSLGFEWHTATVTQTEIIMPMEEPFLGFEWHTITAAPKEVIMSVQEPSTQMAQNFLGHTAALTGAEPGPGPRKGHCKAEDTQKFVATNVIHKDINVPRVTKTVCTPSVASPQGILAPGGCSRLGDYLMGRGMHLADYDHILDAETDFFRDVFQRWYRYCCVAHKRHTRGGLPKRPGHFPT